MHLYHRPGHGPLGLLASSGVVAAALALGACSSSNEHAKSPAALESARAESLVRLDDAALKVTKFREGIADDVAASARCLVVVPALKKGGLVVGGQSGRGFATCQTPNGWSGPAPITISGGSVGAQIGFQESDVLAIVTSDKAKATLEAGDFKVGVDASAAAGPVGVGRGRQFGSAEVLSYSQAKGLFAGATLNGATLKEDNDALTALYGPDVKMAAILEGRVAPPQQAEVDRFLAATRAAFPPSPKVARSGL